MSVDRSGLLDNPHDKKLTPSSLPRGVQRGILAVFLLGLAVAAVFLITDHWRRATFVLGVSLIGLSGARAVCDSKILGVLSVRSRRFDIFYVSVLGALMVFLSASVDSLGS